LAFGGEAEVWSSLSYQNFTIEYNIGKCKKKQVVNGAGEREGGLPARIFRGQTRNGEKSADNKKPACLFPDRPVNGASARVKRIRTCS